jgi:UDP-3-O-[3-hydroxymyristoyl] glucosamine N-acyltransferase
MRLDEIARLIGGALTGDAAFEICMIASLENAGPHDITFLSHKKHLIKLQNSKAGAAIVPPEITAGPFNRITVGDPYAAFATVSALFAEPPYTHDGIHPTALVDPSATIGNDVRIGAYCVIEKNVRIGDRTVLGHHVVVERDSAVGDDCLLYSQVTLGRKTIVGDRVIFHSGVVLGSDGFGFAESGGEYHKIQQLGWVEIGNDVEIGANTCVDRGALGPTRICSGSKLDNLIQIAHNVEVGEHSGLAAQVGISGSTKIGKCARLAGQAGLAGHLEIGDNVFVGAQSGVSKSLENNTAVFGYPARDIRKAKKIEGILSSLPEWIQRIKKLEKDKSS